MKEALFILLILAVIVALTAVRYRRQILAMFRIWQSLKALRQQIKEKGNEASPPPDNVSGGPLVNCAKCGTWVPEQRAIKLRGGSVYCSSACLESMANVR